jgi:predicted dehydrogenase
MVPIELNYRITEAVAKRASAKRLGIIAEKPLAPSLEQAKEARDLAQKYNIPIMIAENFRYNEEMNIIRDLVRNKHIGDTIYFIQNRIDDFPSKMIKDTFQAKEWRQHPDYPGGSLTDTALHDIAGLRHIFGAIDKLQAFGHPQTDDYSPYSVVNVNLLFKNGITGQFAFFGAGKEMQRPLTGLRIFGTQGMIYLEEKSAGTINIAHNDGRSEQLPYKPEVGYYNEILNFYEALTGKEPISVTPEMEYGDLQTINDIITSIQEERIINVDDKYSYHPSYHDAKSQGVQELH